jgi:hypothetical protein
MPLTLARRAWAPGQGRSGLRRLLRRVEHRPAFTKRRGGPQNLLVLVADRRPSVEPLGQGRELEEAKVQFQKSRDARKARAKGEEVA